MDRNPTLTERLTDICEARDECEGVLATLAPDVEHDIVWWPPFAEKLNATGPQP